MPKASLVSVKFSGGGTGPMLSGVRHGRTLSLSWPKPLPRPILAGNIATYPEILPGVDLQLKAEVEGFAQLLVVKSAQAAANPELAQLRFTMDTVGVTVTRDPETGTLEATDPAGQTVFTSPTPLMWDSSTVVGPAPLTGNHSSAVVPQPGPGDPFQPGAGAKDAEMGTAVSGDSLTLVPDQALLKGPDTTYPVYIDPSTAWGDRRHWTRVYKRFKDTSYWNAKEDVRVGFEAQSGGADRISRSFFHMDIRKVRLTQIKSATFRIRNTWSWSCRDQTIEMWQVSGISKKTTWEKQPSKVGNSPQATVHESKGWGPSCPAGNLEFDATALVRATAAKNLKHVTLGLYVPVGQESNTYGWKRFDPKSATMEIKYNNRPKTPGGLGTNPRTDCKQGGLIGNTAVSVYATIDDPDAGNLTAEFEVTRAEPRQVISRPIPALRGRVATLPLTILETPSGKYTWRVRAKDADGAYSEWSPVCSFEIDRSRPGSPPIITSRGNVYPDGTKGWSENTGPARKQAEFNFASNGVNDVVAYHWWTSGDPQVRETPADAPSAFVTPPSYGPHLIHAYSTDRAGNRSDTATYLYYANRAQDKDKPGDLNGDGFKDIWSTDVNGTLLTYAGQGQREFSSATHGGGTFPGQQVAFSGDWLGHDGHNDLVSLEYKATDNRNQLRVYKSSGKGVIAGSDPHQLTVACPVPDPAIECTGEPGWTGDDHWYNAEEIDTSDLNADTNDDLLVKQGKRLWFYRNEAFQGGSSIDGSSPVLVGETDWDQYSLVVPGDLNSDGFPDLLLRHNSSGDIFRSYGKKGPDGGLDLATWGSAATRVKIASRLLPQQSFPSIGSSGDLDGDGNGDGNNDGDGIADVWARKADNTLVGFPGLKTGNNYTGLGTAFLIDGINGGRHLPAGTTLTSGESVKSTSATLTMEAGGNLVLTSNAGKALWSSGTHGNNGATALVRSDGHIAINSPSGVRLWHTGTDAPDTTAGHAILQDRGNLVVHNAMGHALWSSGTALRHDHNRDGRSDMATWYDYTDGSDALLSFTANSDGSFRTPQTAWSAPPGNFQAQDMKRVTGDFNGDGIGDAATVYGYADRSVALWTWTGKGDGTFNAPFKSWSTTPGNWTFGRMTPYSGDFNGDGRDDIAVWYDYADTRDAIWTFTSTVKGGFNQPSLSWSANDTWTQNLAKTVTGDFNGDGRDDLAAFYGYPNNTEKIWTFTSKATGAFAATAVWSSTTWGDWNRTTVHAGDFNGDGRDDLATWFDYADGRDTVHVFTGNNDKNGNAGMNPPYEAWTTAAGSMDRPLMQIVTGDYTGDGRDDLGAMYGYGDGSVRMFTWATKPDGKLNDPAGSWSAPPGNWRFNKVAFLEQHN
ncbi:FG-GAP-like repeat-containing protein [Streptomyces sp. NPDC017979]|uniref:FG-GAP-like repeat-containing protein n=1 Tax=Streptomyces sp. NPDC017979 TaxID=3365024 RepID=UPI0037970CC0